MPKIDSVSWRKVRIDGKDYHQVLIVEERIVERDRIRLEEAFGTDHEIGDWEKEKLISGQPEAILIANGWSGRLDVDEKFREKIKGLGIDLRVVLTAKIIEEYNHLVGEGKRVSCLIHTTC